MSRDVTRVWREKDDRFEVLKGVLLYDTRAPKNAQLVAAGTSAMKTGPAFRPHARFCLNSMLVAGSICKMNMNHLLSMLLRGAFLGLSSGFLGITASCATFVMKERSCEPDALSTTQSCGKGLGEAVWNSHEACNEGSCEICLPKGVRYCWWPGQQWIPHIEEVVQKGGKQRH